MTHEDHAGTHDSHDSHAPGDSHRHEGQAPMRDFGRESWEERYKSQESLWSGRANAQLVDVASVLNSARALDVGCGEGGDSLWLAKHGWDVVAVDLSTTALARGQRAAIEAGLDDRIDWRDDDLAALIAGSAPFDLVTSQYTHPQEGGRWLVETLAPAVAVGGTLLIVGHHPTDPHAVEHAAEQPELRDSAFTAEEIAEFLDPVEWDLNPSMRERVTHHADTGERLWRDSVLLAVRKR